MIELDRDLAARLRRDAGSRGRSRPTCSTSISRRSPPPCGERKLRVVGNLPYNISTPILFHLLEAAERVADQHFMLQKEVVDRMAAAPGGKDYGRLTVMLQWRYDIEHAARRAARGVRAAAARRFGGACA